MKWSFPWANFYCSSHSLPNDQVLTSDLSLLWAMTTWNYYHVFFSNNDELKHMEEKQFTWQANHLYWCVCVCVCVSWRFRGASWWQGHKPEHQSVLDVLHSPFLWLLVPKSSLDLVSSYTCYIFWKICEFCGWVSHYKQITLLCLCLKCIKKK